MARMYLDSGGASTNSGTSDSNTADLSASSDLTVVSNKTFVDGNVDTGTDIVTVTGHGYTSGTGVELTTTGTLPAGLTLTTLYYLCAVSVDTITFHTNVADAEAGTNPVNITAAAGGGTHTINNYTVNLAGAVDLSGVKCHHCRVTTTGTSHVITMAGGIHGLTTADAVFLTVFTGGTMPTGITSAQIYYVNALTTTTFRIYTTAALATTGGASDVNVSAAEVRTLSVFTEVASAINIASSNVSNRKIFWIRAVSDTNNLVIVDQVVTLSATPSNWAIGGRVTASGAVDLFNTVRGGDEIIFNTDISGALNVVNRIAASFIGPGNFVGHGNVYLTGKAGARRVFTNTGNGTLLNPAASSSFIWTYAKNLELQSQGTGAAYSSSGGFSSVFYDCVMSDSGAQNTIAKDAAAVLIRSLFKTLTSGVQSSSSTTYMFQSHITDITGDGLTITTSGNLIAIDSIIERCTDQGIVSTNNGSRAVYLLVGNTLYRSANSGLEETGSNTSVVNLLMFNNILKDNGDASTEANIELLSSARRIIVDKDNVFSISGALGGVNALGYTLDSSDLTSDPLFVDPDAAAGSRNFGLQSTSPAKGISYTFPGSLSVSYRDMGAVQRQEPTGGGLKLAGRGGLAG